MTDDVRRQFAQRMQQNADAMARESSRPRAPLVTVCLSVACVVMLGVALILMIALLGRCI